MNLNLTTAAGLTAAASVILSAITLIVPQTRTKFESLDADTQKSVRGIGVLLLAVLFVAGGCAGVIASAPACNAQSIGDYAIGVVIAAVLSLASTDGVFLVARRMRDRNGAPRLRLIGTPAGKLF